MYKEGFDVYDELPEDMVVYLRYNGRHFNRKLVDFATSKMTTRDSNGKEIALEPTTREQLDDMMRQSNVHLTNNDNPYDMCRKGIQVDCIIVDSSNKLKQLMLI